MGILHQFKTLFPTLRFDMIVGTSTGALISPLAATGEIDLLQKLYTSVRTDDVVTRHRIGDRLGEKSIFTVEPLYKLLKENVPDTRYDAIKASGRDVYLATVCLQTEELVVFTTAQNPTPSQQYRIKTVKDAEHLRLAVLASACQPVMMTPVKVDKDYSNGPDKNYQYVDGGVREYAGIQMAIDQGATEVFAILLSDGKGSKVETEFTDLFSILQRTLGTFMEDVQKHDVLIPRQYEKTLKYLHAVKQKMLADGVPQSKIDGYFKMEGASNPLEAPSPVKIFIITPDGPLGGGPGGLVFDPAEMQEMVNKGRGSANTFAANLKPGDVTWSSIA